LPYSGGDDELDKLPCLQVLSKSEKRGAPAGGMKLEHFDRITEVEVEYLVRVEHVHLRESPGFQQVIDRSTDGPHSPGKRDCARRSIGAAEAAPLYRVRRQVEQCLDFLCGHCHRVYQQEPE